MKRIGKIVLFVFLSVIFLLVVLAIVAAIYENKIAKLAIEKVGESTNIPVDVESIDFSLIRNFPLATIQCNQLTVHTPTAEFKSKNDTLFHADQLFVSVNVKPLLDGLFKVRKVEMKHARAFYNVDTSGVSNIDFLKDTTQENVIDTSSSSIYLDLENLKVNDLICFYDDKKLDAAAKVHLSNVELSGLMKNDSYQGKGEMNATLSDCKYPGTNAHLMQQLDIDFRGGFQSDTLTIDRAGFLLDSDAKLALNGKVAVKDSMWATLVIQAEKLDLEQLGKYLPDSITENYGLRSYSGTLVTDASVNGYFTGSELPSIDAAFKFSGGKIKYQDYPELRNISLEGEANNGNTHTLSDVSLNLRLLQFQTDSSRISLNGTVSNLEHPRYDIRSKMNISLNEIVSFIPDSLIHDLSGRILLDLSTKGVLPDSITDAFITSAMQNTTLIAELQNISAAPDSTIKVENLNGTIKYKSDTTTIIGLTGKASSLYFNLNHFATDADITGNLLKMDSLKVKIDRISAGLDSSNIELSGTVKNLVHPTYNVTGQINIDLSEVQKLVPDSMVNSMTGKINAHFYSAASVNLDSISDQVFSIAMEKSSFDLDLRDVSVEMPDSMMSVSQLSGSLSYKNDTVKISQMNANYMGMLAKMNTVTISSIYAGALQNKAVQITVNGNFFVDQVDYDKLAIFMDDGTSSANSAEVAEPTNFTYKINGNVHIDRLKYEKAVLENIQTKFLVKEGYYVLDSMTTNAFEGSALTSAKIEMGKDDLMTIWFKTNILKMDVVQLVDAFGEYMDYEDIQKNNVQGKLSTVMDGKIVMKNFEPDYEALLLKGDLSLENGALFNVKPVMEVENISGVGIKNLDSLYFSTLNSSIFLFRNDLYIPRTEIRTSSFDAMFLGMYSFGEDYAYHIRMYLGEVLSSKSKANLRKQSQEGGFTDEDEKDVTKGRTSIYVVSKSENGKEKAGFDNKHDRANMVARVNLQQQMVDMRFHPALVSYSTK